MDSEKRRIDRELGDYIYKCFKQSGKTLERFAEELFVEVRTVNYYFTGQRKPSQRTLLRLIKVSNINVQNIPF